jgi:DNA-directed RNA polymerase specialized sigma subunit
MSTPPRGARSRHKKAAANASNSDLEASLGDVEREILVVLRALRVTLGREPTLVEIAERLGLAPAQVRPRLAALDSLGLKSAPTPPVASRRRGHR